MKRLKSLLFICTLPLIILTSCNNAENTAGNVISKTGRTIGKGTTQFVKGIKEGVNKTLQCNLELTPALQQKGITAGKFFIGSSKDATDNVLSAYLIFNKDYKGKIKVKVFDKDGKEYGRTNLGVIGNKDDGSYFDFVFDSHIEIESKSRFILE